MCGRFAFYAPRQAVLDTFGVDLPFDLVPRYNVAPSQLADTTLFDFASLRARPRVDDALIRAVNVG